MKRFGVLLFVFAIVFNFAMNGNAQDKVNLALNKPVTEQGHAYESVYWNKNFVTDGFKIEDDNEGQTNGWFSDASANKDDKTWIYVDLEAAYKVSTVAVYPRESEKYFPVAYEIQVSTNAESWTTVKTVTGDSGKLDVNRVFTITPTEARYVRVLVTERYNESVNVGVVNGYIAQISEIEVYKQEEVTEPTTVPETNAETSDEGLVSYVLFLFTAVILLSLSKKRNYLIG